MKNKKKTTNAALSFLVSLPSSVSFTLSFSPSCHLSRLFIFSSAGHRQSGRRTKNGNATRKTPSTGVYCLRTEIHRSALIVHSAETERGEREREGERLDDSGLKWRRVYNRTDGGIYGTAEDRFAARETVFRSVLSHLPSRGRIRYFFPPSPEEYYMLLFSRFLSLSLSFSIFSLLSPPNAADSLANM